MQPHVQLERKDETTNKAADEALKAALSFLSPYSADTEEDAEVAPASTSALFE